MGELGDESAHLEGDSHATFHVNLIGISTAITLRCHAVLSLDIVFILGAIWHSERAGVRRRFLQLVGLCRSVATHCDKLVELTRYLSRSSLTMPCLPSLVALRL